MDFIFISTVTIGENHPQDLVEGAGLSCVKPPPITYRLKMEARFYQKHENDDAFLSKAQLEPIIYACQAHKSYINKDKKIRRGFLLGSYFNQYNYFINNYFLFGLHVLCLKIR